MQMQITQNRFYHFTPRWMLESIKKQGISEGKLVIQTNPPKFKGGHQWLTINPDFNQSWCEYSMLPYDRSEVRIEVAIQKIAHLYKWTQFGEKMAGKEMFDTLSEFGDPENWYIYRGIITPMWFLNIDYKCK